MKFFVIILVFALFSIEIFAQEKEIAHNNDLWFSQITKAQVSDYFGLENELHFRLSDWGSTKQQLLFRPSIFYRLNDLVRFNLGYTRIETYPYGQQPVALKTPENNIWGQVTIDHAIGRITFSHRYRLEQRWTGRAVTNSFGRDEINGSLHRNRIRYRITAKKTINGGSNYLAAFNELWINFGDNTGSNNFDQNWLYIAFGKKVNDHLAVEAGYLWQVIEKADGYQYESNNTIQFTAHYSVKKKTINK